MKTIHYPWANIVILSFCLILGAGCSRESKVQHILEAADRDFKAENFDKAEDEYKSVFRLSAENPVAWRQLALIYAEEGRQIAGHWLQLAYKKDQKNPELNLKLAEFYQVGNPKQALTNAEAVLEAEPDNAEALVILAQVTTNTGLGILRQRLETQLREGGQGAAGCHTAIGVIDLRENRISDAETEFHEATKLDPKLPLPYRGLSLICSMHNDPKGTREALKSFAELSPIRSEARLQYVGFALQSGDDDQAKQILLDITRQAPDYIPAWVTLMKIYFSTHKYKECQDAIDKILARDNSNYQALILMGRLALAEYDAGRALAAFQRLQDSYKPNPEIWYYIAVAHLMNHERQKAIMSLNEALKLDPNYAPPVLMLADLDYRDDKITDAISLLSQLTEKQTNNADAQFALAGLYVAQNRLDRAREVYATMSPTNPEVARRIGQLYQIGGKAAQAQKAYEKSLELMPNYLPALENITDLDISQNRFKEAHQRVIEAIKEKPASAEMFLLQGRIYLAEKNTNDAEAAYSKAVELNPDQPDAYMALARLYLSTHQEQQAIERLAPLVAKTNIGAMLEMGEIQQSDGQYEKASDTYEKILNVSSNFLPALNNLAYVDSEYLSNVDRAAQLAEKARDFSPTDPNTADTLGWILYKKKQYSRALNLIQESSEKQPDDPEVQMHLGMAYYMMAEEKPAREFLKKAVENGADFPGKELARNRLEVLGMDPAKATPDMIQKIETLVQKDPGDPVLLSRLASIQEQRGDVQKAAETLETLISMNHENWPAMIKLARIEADRLNELRKATELAKSAHELAPNDGGATALLGDLIYRAHDYSWSSSLLSQAADQSPNDPSIQYSLAWANYAVGRVAAADAAMKKAVEAGDAVASIAKAKQFLALREAVKDPAQAAASSGLVNQVLANDANDVPALMVSALISEQAGKTNEAESVWTKVLSIYPDFAPAKRELAVALSHSLRSEDKDKAYELAQKAIESMPDDLELSKTLGILAYGRKEWGRSALYLQSFEKSTNDSVSLCYLGMDYDKLKEPEKCTNALQLALASGNLPPELAGQARTILSQVK